MHKLTDNDVIQIAQNLVAIIQNNNDNEYSRVNKIYLSELNNLLETRSI